MSTHTGMAVLNLGNIAGSYDHLQSVMFYFLSMTVAHESESAFYNDRDDLDIAPG